MLATCYKIEEFWTCKKCNCFYSYGYRPSQPPTPVSGAWYILHIFFFTLLQRTSCPCTYSYTDVPLTAFQNVHIYLNIRKLLNHHRGRIVPFRWILIHLILKSLLAESEFPCLYPNNPVETHTQLYRKSWKMNIRADKTVRKCNLIQLI